MKKKVVRTMTTISIPCPACGRTDIQTRLGLAIHLSKKGLHKWGREKIQSFFKEALSGVGRPSSIERLSPTRKHPSEKPSKPTVLNASNYKTEVEGSMKNIFNVLDAVVRERDFYLAQRDEAAKKLNDLESVLREVFKKKIV